MKTKHSCMTAMLVGVLFFAAGCGGGARQQADKGPEPHPQVYPPKQVEVPAPPHRKIDLPPLTYAPEGSWADNAHIALSPTVVVFEVNGMPVDIGIETVYRDSAGKIWREPAPGRTAQRRNAHPYEFISLPPGAHMIKIRHRTDRLDLEDVDFRPEVDTKDTHLEANLKPGRNYYMTHLYYRFDVAEKIVTSNWLYLAEIVEGTGPDGKPERMFLIVDNRFGGLGMTLEHEYTSMNLWERSPPSFSAEESWAIDALYREADWRRAQQLQASGQ